MSKLDEFILASAERHAFLVAEIQRSEQRTIDEFEATLKTELEPIKNRVCSLETTRTDNQAVVRTIGIAIPAVGSLAWVVFKLGNMFSGKTP